MNLGNELKVERTRLDVKAKDVANEIGVTPQQISNIERCKKATNILKYVSFLRSKGVDLNNLFDRINYKEQQL